MNSFDYFQPRLQCRTSQGQRNDLSYTQSVSKPGTSYSRRTDIHRTETYFQKTHKIKDSKKVLMNVCNEIDKVFPKEKSLGKGQKLEFNEIKSQGVRISVLELQYLLVKKNWFDQEIKDVMIRIAHKISKQLEKIKLMMEANRGLKSQNSNLKGQLPSWTEKGKEKENERMDEKEKQREKQEESQKRRLLKSAGRMDCRMMMENNRLESINKELVRIIEESSKNKTEEKMEMKSREENWRTEEIRNKISYLQLKLSTEEKSNNEMGDKLEEKQKVVKQLEERVKALEGENLKLKEGKQEWMGRALMQMEDKKPYHQPKPHSKDLTEVHQLRKMNSIKKQETRRNSNLEIKVNLERRLVFGYQVDFFRSIRTHYLQNKTACYNMNIRWRGDQLGLNYQKVQFSQTNQQQEQIFPLHQLSFYRPSFYSFVEHLHKKQNDNYELSRSLIQKMRCIMQSKLNEFLIFENVSQFTYFPEFVFSWFKKYYFDSDRNCIVESMCSEESGYEAFKFYKDLMNVKLDQTWEVVTFREFLLQELSLEDLYFYLQCQHMLYRKSGITEEIQYLGEFLVLVKYSVAKSVLDIILKQFDSWNVQFLISKMNQKVVKVKNQEFIQSAFFLRCLLEYYKIERMNRYKFIRKVARQLKENEKFPTLGYLDFMKIISKFPDITESNRLTIFRDCYSVGRGVITPEIIFTVCSQSRVFMKNLKLKSFYKLPIQTSKSFESGTLFCIQPPHPYLYRIFIKMKKILAEGSSFSRKIMSLGVEELSHKIEFYRKYFLQWKSFNDSSILKCKHFLHFVKECLSIVSSVNYYQIHQLLMDQGKLSNKININLDENEIGEIYAEDTQSNVQMIQNTVGLLEWKVKLQRMRENISAKKIQRMVRKKFIQPYVEIYNVMFDKVKKLKYFGNAATVV